MAEGGKVPDFRLQLGDGAGIVVEVKQFHPNPEEQEASSATRSWRPPCSTGSSTAAIS